MDESIAIPHTNPYFNPEPTVLFMALKILAVINVLIAGVCLYTIAFKSPPFMSRVFVGLLLYHFGVASFLVTNLCLMAFPIFYLPYIAIRIIGPYSSLGVSPLLQFIFIAIFWLITASTAVPLFYYRMDSILPPGHILNSKWLRYLVYIMVYVVFNTVPGPVLYAAVAYENQLELKLDLFRLSGVYYEDFLSDRVVAARMGQNPFVTVFIYSLVFLTILGIAVVLISSYVIWQLTSKVGIIGSVRYKDQQRQLFISLIIMTVVFLTALAFILPGILTLLIFNSYRADLINWLIFLASASVPLALGSYVFTYRPYRRFIFGPFRKVSPSSSHLHAIKVLPSSFVTQPTVRSVHLPEVGTLKL